MTGQSKIPGKFYPLTPEVAERLRKAKLTAAEWRIWSYLSTLEPYGDKYADVETLTVMGECECSKATFYRAIAKFQRIRLFDFQDKGWSFKNETGVSKMRKQSQKCETSLKNETEILKNETNFSKMRQPEAQTLAQSESQTSKNFKIKKIKKTFSEEVERENFVKFCKRRADEMPVKVVLTQSWIEANFDELLEMYKESTGQIEAQEKEKPSAGVDSDEELINAALESGEIEDYDMGCKSVRYPGTKWWTDVEDFLATKRENQSSNQLSVTSNQLPNQSSVTSNQLPNQLPVTPEEAPEAEEITETPKAQGEFVLPDFKLKTLNRSAQRVIEEALRNGEIEAHDQVNGMVKIKGNRWWTYTDEFVAAKRKSQSSNQLSVTSYQLPGQSSVISHQSSATSDETEGETKGEG